MERQRDAFKEIMCPECGGKFKQIPGEYGHYRCTVCREYEAYMEHGKVRLINVYEDDNDDEDDNDYLAADDMDDEEDNVLYSDDRPFVCTGCGSDCYPDCREACSFFDD